MSLPREEARSLDEVFEFLLELSSGRIKVNNNATELRRQARRLVKHYPLAAGARWLEFEKTRELAREIRNDVPR